jgi:hypothetical protein
MNLRKKLYIIGIVLIFFTVITSCKKNDKEIEIENLTAAIKQSNVKGDFKWIVVLPGLGCHGCIQEGEAFMRDNIHSDILFVLTKISSLKILQQKTGIMIEEFPNIYIDRENIFDLPTENSIYPCIIRIKNGKIADHEFQSPQNRAAFRKLKRYVLAK